jgi:hypothetical protein
MGEGGLPASLAAIIIAIILAAFSLAGLVTYLVLRGGV